MKSRLDIYKSYIRPVLFAKFLLAVTFNICLPLKNIEKSDIIK